MNREFLQLAKNYDDHRHFHIGGWLVSEKLDGQRAWWDGGVTRGIPANEVPWANTKKDARLLTPPIATGLWSRYGKVIHAPDWWLDFMPKASLDGELYIGRGKFQELSSIIKHHDKSQDWSSVKFMAFDMPAFDLVLADGRINNPNFQKQINAINCVGYINAKLRGTGGFPDFCQNSSPFASRYYAMNARLPGNLDNFKVHYHMTLPSNLEDAQASLERFMQDVLSDGGEGVILRDPLAIWEPKRIRGCLKYKPFTDDEAVVTGYIWGRETDKGSKLLGKMGALIVEWNGKTFELSGFTDEERRMKLIKPPHNWENEDLRLQEPSLNAGEQTSDDWHCPAFPLNSHVTFRYRELTDEGIPREARFLRKRDAE